ncbi:MAG: ribosome assembly RNA-binding protein YhbY [Betaproteobacteria bacterium]|nr:ribosome assembly RNA-binding protein YhbY [Betaproteobacteria bacterium]
MSSLTLTPADRSAKRALAHSLKPSVLVGDQGLSEAVLAEIDRALKAHDLIKVRVPADDREARAQMLETICDRLGAAPVQSIGRMLVLYRPLPAKADEAAERSPRGAGPRRIKVVVPSSSPTHRPKVKRLTVLGNQRVTPTGKVKRAKPRRSSVKKVRLG